MYNNIIYLYKCFTTFTQYFTLPHTIQITGLTNVNYLYINLSLFSIESQYLRSQKYD